MSQQCVLPISQQVVIISGAGRGLGAKIAEAFAREGAAVVINWRRSQQSAEALAARLGERAIALQADVTDLGAVKRMVSQATERFGPPTTLIHNALADYSFNGDLRDTVSSLTWEKLAAQVNTAASGALHLVQSCEAGMRAQGFGRVVLIGSNLVHHPVVPYHDYTAAKGALLALTRTMSRELGSAGITINMLSAGLLRVTDASRATPDLVFDMIASNTPLGQRLKRSLTQRSSLLARGRAASQDRT